MLEEKMSSSLIARIHNEIMYAQNKLTPIQQRIIVYMACYIAKTDHNFRFYSVPVKDLSQAVAPNYKWGNIYADLFEILQDLGTKNVRFFDSKTDRNTKGKFITWLASAEIKRDNKNSPWLVELEFSEKMKPYLLKLAGEFSEIPYGSFVQLQSNHAISIYKLIKANYWAKKENGIEQVKKNQFKISLKKLRFITNTEKTYSRYIDFKRRILKKAETECQKKMDLYFVFDDKKFRNNKNQVTDILFTIFRNKEHEPVKFNFPDLTNSEKKDSKNNNIPDYLSESKKRAVGFLIKYGVNHNLSLILVEEHCKGSELEGCEDSYIKFVLEKLEISRKKRIEEVKKGLHKKIITPDDKKGGRVKKVLTETHYFSEFMEYLALKKRKNSLEKENPRSGFNSLGSLLNNFSKDN